MCGKKVITQADYRGFSPKKQTLFSATHVLLPWPNKSFYCLSRAPFLPSGLLFVLQLQVNCIFAQMFQGKSNLFNLFMNSWKSCLQVLYRSISVPGDSLLLGWLCMRWPVPDIWKYLKINSFFIVIVCFFLQWNNFFHIIWRTS